VKRTQYRFYLPVGLGLGLG